MDKSSFIVRVEIIEQLELLTNEQRGAVFIAMCYYVRDGVLPEFTDPLLRMMFSIVKGQIDRDAEKYTHKCLKNAENGRKGGRPRKEKTEENRTVFEKNEKTERFLEKPKKAYPDPVCDSDPEPDPVCDRVCDRDARDAQKNTPHTQHAEMDVDGVLRIAASLGYVWEEDDARDFLAYNMDKGRTDGWSYAVQRWEANRQHYADQGRKHRRSGKIIDQKKHDKLMKYSSLANRFKEDDAEDGTRV